MATPQDGPAGRFTIQKSFSFEAAHHLPDLPQGHKCRRPHGHGYTVSVVVAADELDQFGFVTDFGELAPFKHYLAECFDHQDLNTVLGFAPTSELLARHFGVWFIDEVEDGLGVRLESVTVSETTTSSATWHRAQL